MPIMPEKNIPFRIPCSVTTSTASLEKRDFLRHNEEEPGVIKYCTHPDCTSPGTQQASRLRAHSTRNHSETCGSWSCVSMTKNGTDGSEQYP
jgi:hypothetical protein